MAEILSERVRRLQPLRRLTATATLQLRRQRTRELGELSILAAMREVRAKSPMAGPQVGIMGLEIVQMLLFAGLVVLAVWYRRRRRDVHKRLMLLTIACMLPSALARIPLSFITNADILMGLYGFVIVCIALDTTRHRRLHPALAWGGLVVLGALHLTFLLVQTPAWMRVGQWMVS
jgi:hypothetical protein